MASKTEVLAIRKGQTLSFGVGPIDDPSGSAVATFTASDTPSAQLWDGDATATIATPPASWQADPAANPPVVVLAFAGSTTAALEVQPYPLQVWIAHSGGNLLAWEGWLDVLAGAGHGDGRHGLWLFRRHAPGRRRVGEGPALHLGHGRVRPGAGPGPELPGRRPARAVRTAGPAAGRVDISLGLGWYALPEAPSAILRGYLAAGGLIVTDKVREIVSHLAVAYACRRDVASGDYKAKADFHWLEPTG